MLENNCYKGVNMENWIFKIFDKKKSIIKEENKNVTFDNFLYMFNYKSDFIFYSI